MPLIIPSDPYGAWISHSLPPDKTRAIVTPHAPEAMRTYSVSRAVNDPKNDDRALLELLPPGAAESPGPGESSGAPA
jgi:putative SOS response-associated peptidase YedK